eukprot:TRINITY_DN17821_c0_g1_i1.p1 TRINITY_DN17821_c0_g1~~TRINITY_DN17821_c0_g1_i1.p1  ORF type:complete len:160 (+),score=56.44 TRINITY_DN17821_c0_g1_i1:71-550(+)
MTSLEYPWNKLHLAIVQEKVDEVNYILQKHRFSVNTKTHRGNSPLHLAATDGNIELIGLLVRAGGECNAINQNGETPLHFAAASGSVASVMCLVRKGSILEVEDEEGRTPVEWAVESGHKNVVRLLIALGSPRPRCETEEEEVREDENCPPQKEKPEEF